MAVNTQLLAKGWYLFNYLSQACLVPYLPIILRGHGLHPSSIGLLLALQRWVNLPAATAWARFADARGAHRATVIVGMVVNALTLVGAAVMGDRRATLALLLLNAAGSNAYSSIIDATCVADIEHKGRGEYGRVRLYGAVGWGISAVVAGGALERFGLSVAIGMFVGYCCCSVTLACFLPYRLLVAGARAAAKDALSEAELVGLRATSEEVELGSLSASPSERDLAAADASLSAADVGEALPEGEGGPAAGGGSVLPPGGSGDLTPAPRDAPPATEPSFDSIVSKREVPGTFQGQPPPPSLWRALLNPEVLLFLATSVVMGTVVGQIETQLFLYLQSLGGTSLLMGLCLFFTCVSEVYVFAIAGQIISRLGTWGCQHLIFLAFVLRLVAYALLPLSPTLYIVLVAELLHGLTFGLAWATGTIFFAEAAPEGLSATFQSVYQGAYFGLGHGLGGIIGGQVFERAGPTWMLVEAAGLAAAGWLSMTVLLALVRSGPSRRVARAEPLAATAEL